MKSTLAVFSHCCGAGLSIACAASVLCAGVANAQSGTTGTRCKADADMQAQALKRAGVKVDHKIYDGVTHEFFGMAAVVAKAKDAQAFAGRALRRSLDARK